MTRSALSTSIEKPQKLSNPRELGKILVTGAAGFLGNGLVRKLLEEGCSVRVLVHSTPVDISHANLEVASGDISSADDMLAACQGIDTVFHTAANICLLGGIAASSAYRRKGWKVNVQGTQNTIDACVSSAVTRLIYTSSVDVVFDGSSMPNMTEDLPYASATKSIYAETKIEAERRVLASNGKGGLLTCAIRPDGIYGGKPNEMIDRFHDQLCDGRLVARIGSASVLQDNSQIDNLIHGELLAAMHLVTNGNACGQPYFIGDNAPMNSFEFFRPLIEGLGHPFPAKEVPSALLRPILAIWQSLYFWRLLPKPLLSPHELDKISVTHYASMDKAAKELGYVPVKTVAQAMTECLEYCRNRS